MRKLFLSVAALAAMLVSGSMTQRAEAVTIGSPAGMQGAVDNLAVLDRVHCVPGWPHHYPTNWRRRDGCARGGGVVVPHYGWRRGHWHRHHHHHHRHHHHRHHHHRHHHRHRH